MPSIDNELRETLSKEEQDTLMKDLKEAKIKHSLEDAN